MALTDWWGDRLACLGVASVLQQPAVAAVCVPRAPHRGWAPGPSGSGARR